MITKKNTKNTKKAKKSNVNIKKNSSPRKTSKAMLFLEKLTGGRLTLGEAIRSIRECDEIKQSDFAKKLGVSQSYLCDLENDRKEVSPKKAAEFARILEDSESQFVRLAIQDMLIRQGLHYTIELHKAA